MAKGRERHPSSGDAKMEENGMVCTSSKSGKRCYPTGNRKSGLIYKCPSGEDSLSIKALMSDRLAFIEANTCNAFSMSSINKIVHCNRYSTEVRYQEQFAEFYNYISIFYDIKAFPFSAVINFFNSLVERNLAYQTILNYRSALSKPIDILFNVQLCNVGPLNDLLKYVKSHHVKNPCNFVPWSIDKTLLMLEDPPADYCNDLFICKKAFFLCLLADPRRISEVCALTLSKSSFCSDSVILRSHSGFTPKNATASFCPQEIVIPSFAENPSLCPVLNLSKYLKLTESIAIKLNKHRPDFLWVDLNLKPVTQKTCRQWFRDVIFLADPSASIKNMKFHSVRGSVASALDFKGCSVKQILQLMNWKSESTYKQFYAKLNLQANVKAVIGGVLS